MTELTIAFTARITLLSGAWVDMAVALPKGRDADPYMWGNWCAQMVRHGGFISQDIFVPLHQIAQVIRQPDETLVKAGGNVEILKRNGA